MVAGIALLRIPDLPPIALLGLGSARNLTAGPQDTVHRHR
ncbi:phage holin family protein [Burkholderia sp. S-53]|nr:phage holin family protein [Burkholderia sp. S-53]